LDAPEGGEKRRDDDLRAVNGLIQKKNNYWKTVRGLNAVSRHRKRGTR